jgi:hypothetical protein
MFVFGCNIKNNDYKLQNLREICFSMILVGKKYVMDCTEPKWTFRCAISVSLCIS